MYIDPLPRQILYCLSRGMCGSWRGTGPGSDGGYHALGCSQTPAESKIPEANNIHVDTLHQAGSMHV